jgi:hypothetical protein
MQPIFADSQMIFRDEGYRSAGGISGLRNIGCSNIISKRKSA